MSTVTASSVREHRVTARSLAVRKRKGERISMLTAYDFTFAQIFDTAGVDSNGLFGTAKGILAIST